MSLENLITAYSRMRHCSTAAGRATYAYCNNLQELYGSSHSYLQNLVVDAQTCGINEAHNLLGANRCQSSNQCAGNRTCSDANWCEGVSGCPATSTQGCSINEAHNMLGANRCDSSSQCAGNRTCSAAKWCEGVSGCAPTPTPAPAPVTNVKVMHLKDWCLGNDSAEA